MQQAQLRPDLYEAARRREPKVTHGSMMARDRAFDPVLGRFRDEGVEQSTAQREREAAVVASNRGRDKQLRVSQRYDIVTHKALVDDEPVATARPPSQTYRSRVGFNIISNEPLADHHFDRPDRRPRGGDSGLGGGGARAHVAHTSMERDFDVVTGRYLADHEAKAARDDDIARRRAADRWWQTRDFDPVRQRYYDADKDSKAAEAEAASQQRRGAAKASALPPAERLRETAGYDVVGHRVIDEERMREIDAKIHRPLVKPLRQATEARLTKEGVAAAELAAERSVRRAGLKNARDLPDRRPFDVLTGAPLRGVDAADAHGEETRSLFRSVAALEGQAGRAGREAGAPASTASAVWAQRSGTGGRVGALRTAGAGTVASAQGGRGALPGTGTLATNLGLTGGGGGFGTVGGLAASTASGGGGGRGFQRTTATGLLTTSAQARAIGAAPEPQRVRDPRQEPVAVRAARGARRVKATGDAWRAVSDKAPPSTRVRRR